MAVVYVAMTLVAETGARLVAKGHQPTTFVSPNVPGVAPGHNIAGLRDVRAAARGAGRTVSGGPVPAPGSQDSRPDPSAAAFAGMFLFGIAAALLGATLPLLSERLEIGLGRVGTLFLVMNACMLASSFALGALQDRFGMKPPLVAGPLVVGAALLVVAGAESYAQLLLAVALLGVGGSALNGASNALVADLHEDPAAKSAALNRVGLFFGFGALFIPFAIGLLLRAAGLARDPHRGRGPVHPRRDGERPARPTPRPSRRAACRSRSPPGSSATRSSSCWGCCSSSSPATSSSSGATRRRS